MTPPQDPALPDGSWVEWKGRVYKGSIVVDPPASVRVFAPTPEDDQFTRSRSGGWTRVLPETEVVQFQLRTYCRWQGERFAVADRTPDGRLSLVWTGRDAGRAAQLGLQLLDKYTWGTTVPASEVTDLAQERHDVQLTPRRS
ncbi:hypothetical protein DMO24_19175 [Modestobacter versicolor]|uniref:Uncharacterized protein n=1 Tax=Modestobacter versicolor TaxID=429133 RepID=A0A323V6M0_9ACTN|nr:hypothetical protein DMO24_19175 [Modestobacter versicolor]